ncbi:MAG: hypothetical protein O6952_08890, partial [Planctomycetota bacterium]|nr:hypothetical protein [Planctomycetota bacterium]
MRILDEVSTFGGISTMNSGTSPIIEAEHFCSRGAKVFRTDAEILQVARALFSLRAKTEWETEPDVLKRIQHLDRKLSRILHVALSKASSKLHIANTFRRLRLTQVEREILLGLTLSATGMVDRVSDIEDLQKLVCRRGKDGLNVVKSLQGGSRLVAREMVILETGDLPVLSEIKPGPNFLEPLLVKGHLQVGWRVKNYEDLLDRTYAIFRALRQRADELSSTERWNTADPDTSKTTTQIKRLLYKFYSTASEHPEWPMIGLLDSGLQRQDLYVVILLLGKELGFQSASDELFTGEG